MKKEFLNLEYKVLFSDYSSSLETDGYQSTVTIAVFQINDKSQVISHIGNFNYKFLTKNNKEIDKLILDHMNDIANFKVKNQKKINKEFDKLTKSIDSI